MTPIRLATAMLVFAASSAAALTPVDEGFTTRVNEGEEGYAVPSNRVTRVTAGTDFAHFVRYQGLPAGRTSLRCRLAEPGGKVQVDEIEQLDDLQPAGYLFCPYETDEDDAELGSLTATIWINGERMSEQVLEVAKGGGRRMSVYKQYKYAIGALAGIIVAGFWLRKKLAARRGDAAARVPISIGSRADAAAIIAAADAARPAPVAQAALELQKAARQYQALLGQSDSKKTLEAGRSYIALLVREREPARAFEVFHQCLALDPAFRTARGEDVLPIAKAARAAGLPKVAVAAVRGFDKSWPGHAAIPEVFMFSAQLLAEDLGNPDMARKILAHLIARYPGHHSASEAKRYLQAMPQPA